MTFKGFTDIELKTFKGFVDMEHKIKLNENKT